GMIIISVSLMLALYHIPYFSNLLITLYCFFIITGSMQTLTLAAKNYEASHRVHFNFWRSLFTLAPDIEKDTVLILNGHPYPGTLDAADTEHLRNFLGKKCVYFYNDSYNEITEHSDHYKISTPFIYPIDSCADRTVESLEFFYEPMKRYFWTIYWDKKTVEVPKDKVIYLRWDNEKQSMSLVHSKSNKSRILKAAGNKYVDDLLNIDSVLHNK
ncbi:MAG TPA: hypothetical protein PL169_25765, partial [Leptospiraceae bacterium]|nr:hypothetical protein [Leptospiraceae bacterium]